MESFEINMIITVKADNAEAARIISQELDQAILCHPDFFDCLEEIEVDYILEVSEEDEEEE